MRRKATKESANPWLWEVPGGGELWLFLGVLGMVGMNLMTPRL